jgi:hypothetical protein
METLGDTGDAKNTSKTHSNTTGLIPYHNNNKNYTPNNHNSHCKKNADKCHPLGDAEGDAQGAGRGQA